MRTSITLLSCVTLAFSVGITASAKPVDDTPLQESMGSLNSGLRSFRKALKAETPDQEAALAQIVAMQSATQISKVQVPVKAESMSAEDGRALTKGYRMDLIELQRELLKLELLILEEDYKAADGSIRRLMEMKKAGHDKYMEDA